MNLSFEQKLEMFANELNLNKFNQREDSIKFSDNTNMGIWFNNNKKAILSSPDELSLIKNQYEEYLNNIKRLSKDEKIKEFIEESNLNKFNQFDDAVKFSDDVNMCRWFNKNRKTLLLDDIFCLSIIKQYKNYTKKNAYKNQLYRCKEFLFELDFNKFSFEKILRFSDGYPMNIWFIERYDILKTGKNNIFVEILKQYEKYLDTLFSENQKSKENNFSKIIKK